MATPILEMVNKLQKAPVTEYPNSPTATKPVVTVIVQTYQHAPYIRQCLDNILNQKASFPFEILIGEDDSTDGTREICIEYAKKNPGTIRLFLHDRKNNLLVNGNPSGRFLFLYNLSRAKGKYIAMCEGDDFWTNSNKLQEQVALLENNPDCTICFHNACNEDKKGKRTEYVPDYEIKARYKLEDVLFKNIFPTCSAVFRNSFINKLPRLIYEVFAADWLLHILNAKHGDILFINKQYGVRRRHKDGLASGQRPLDLMMINIDMIRTVDRYYNYKYSSLAQNRLRVIQERISKQLENKTPYLNPELHEDNMDLYYLRNKIVENLKKYLKDCSGIVLDLGCGKMPYKPLIYLNPKIKQYIGIDIKNPVYQKHNFPSMYWDGQNIPLKTNSVDHVIATELFEHLKDPVPILTEILKVLKPEGTLFFTVPYLWPIHDAPHDEYRYTPFALERIFTRAGFTNIKIKAHGGWDASLAQMIGLWIKRKPMPEQLRAAYKKDLFPFYQQLIENDVAPESFDQGPMITGLYGTVVKSAVKAVNNPIKTKALKKHGPRAVIITSLFPKLSETFILDQITGLLDRNVDFEIWALEDPKEASQHNDIKKYSLLSKTHYIKLPDTKAPLDNNQWFRQFVKINPGIDIEQTSMFHVHFGITFNRLKPLFKSVALPVVVSFHGLDASQYIKTYGDNCYDTLFKRASLITTPSHFMKNVLTQRGCPDKKVRVHRYGVNLDKFKPVTSPPTPDNSLTVLTVGRLVEKKGLKNALKAFAQTNHEKALYRIIGDGPLKEDLIKLTQKLGIKEKVHFLGSHTKDRIVSEMQKADIFMLPSITAKNGDQEGVPVTLIEAHAMGLPIISTRHSGIPELVIDRSTGLLAEEQDIATLSENLKTLMSDPELRNKMSREAQQRVQTEFNIELLNDKLSTIYSELIQPDQQCINTQTGQGKLKADLNRDLLPNLFIIGSMKSGTTSLHRYLDLHPEISMSREKEPHLFERHWCPEDNKKWKETLKWYTSLFKDKKVRGESSTGYTMYPDRPDIPQRIYSMVPDAKLIYLVRDPIDRIISHYIHNLSRGYTESQSVRQFLHERGQNYPLLISNYYMQLEQYLKYFSSSQILVVNFADLKYSREKTMNRIFQFLEVEPSFSHSSFETAFNVSKADITRPQMPDSLRKKILTILLDDIKNLAKFGLLDLSAWLYGLDLQPSSNTASRLRLAKHYLRNKNTVKACTYLDQIIDDDGINNPSSDSVING